MIKNKKYKPRRGPLPFRYVFLLTFVFFMFSTAGGLWIINEGLKPTLVSYAETQTSRIGTLVINKAVSKKIANVMDINEVTQETDASDGEGGYRQFNTEIITRVQNEIVNLVQLNLKEAERGNLKDLEFLTDVDIEESGGEEEGIVFSVPIGQATNNALLGNLGPKVPVKFNAIGDVVSDIETEVQEFGINNAMVKVYIHVQVNVQIIIPFATDTKTIEQKILVAMGLMKGEVPQFFNSGGDSAPSIEVPLD
ncbi:sporulation protein YunB [Bacillus salacetis]|uniref:Sporulation protein YunB n=1 Tax=Bacillus salacetis TaxID=2315464 RepID=A0A3A1R7B0_9BACI|nr:sporulation protein YunB [Bacillus salacetis]RIW38877.1 sporulation protein YunB [Bacillus salacetis]